jgi:tripartite ATP-independent transporter DctP family solute receptor
MLGTLGIASLVLVLGACSSQVGETATEEAPVAAAPAEVCESVSAKAAHHITATSAVHRGLETLAADVSAATEGRVTIEILSDAQLGGLAEMPENLRSGAVDIALVDTGAMGGFDAELGVTDLPFLWESMDEFNDVIDSPVGDLFNDKVRAIGIEPLYWSAVGLRDMFFTNVEVTTPEQLSGLKMRVPQAKVWVLTFEALNASPTPIAGGEIYSSLESGVIDGFELPLGTTVDLNLNEVVKFQAKTGHILTHIMIGASPAFLDKLCVSDRAALDAAAATAQNVTRQGWKDDNAAAAAVLEAELTVNDADIAAFRSATASVLDTFVVENGSVLLDAIKAQLGR